MRRITMSSLILFLTLSVVGLSAPPTLTLPKELNLKEEMLFVELKLEGEYKYLVYEIDEKCAVIKTVDPKTLVIVSKTPGVYQFKAVASSEDGITDFVTTKIVVLGSNPFPPSPNPPTPFPPNPPVPPNPTPNNFDPYLLIKLKDARAKDSVSGIDIKKSYDTLANTYLDTASILSASSDPALRPKTWGEFLERLKRTSIANGVPQLPYLANTRLSISEYVGALDNNQPFDDALLNKCLDKFPKVGSTLREANK